MWLFFKKSEFKYDPPYIMYQFPLIQKNKWSWYGNKIAGIDTIKSRYTAEVCGQETVSVTAGAFNCIKIKMTNEDEKGNYEEFYQWLAPGIGVVRGEGVMKGTGLIGLITKITGGEIKYELEKYDIK